MNPRDKNVIVWVIIIIVLLIIGIFSWQYYAKSRNAENGNNQNNATTTEEETTAMLITAKHQFKDGKHIVAGEVNLPTPCHSLTSDIQIAKSNPEQVTIKFTSASQAEFCAQVITPERFKIEFEASGNAVIKATWNGADANLNLVPVAPGEDIENFEVFIKG